ncbi:AI-2E family transporter [uncultured Tyzzerella sp.]|uniref:AI-2E family transporter n=1 Tax=uncultured Tyzzerella sp. TaxID=2321398 RepID=UPI002943491B|nr:AI-2E family transporter [uncultured Tyzzerella sp.]
MYKIYCIIYNIQFLGGVFIKSQNFIKNNKKYFKLGLCLILVAIITIIFYRSSSKLDISVTIKEAKDILAPFIYGIGIAYILNSSLKFLENKILSKIRYLDNRKKLKRGISITTAYVILFSFLIWLISYLIPEIRKSIIDVSDYFKTFDTNAFDKMLKENIPIDDTVISEVFVYIQNFLMGFIEQFPYYIKRILSSTLNIASILLNVVLGIVISIYILFDKEAIGERSRKIVCAILPKRASENLIQFCKESNNTFEKFFVGKIIDSTIIGIIFFVGATILKAPFAMLLSIIIGVTNMIPFFGPFIGAVPVIFITLIFDIANPLKALWILIFILLLQQFDGNILGPKILGDSIGIKPIGIIFSIIVGGAIFGPPGMFFGVPIFAVIFSTFNRFVDRRYDKKYGGEK